MIFDSVLAQTNFSPSKTESDTSLLVYFSGLKTETANQFSLEHYYLAQENLLKKDNGINFTVEGLQNLKANPTQDLEDNISFRSRFGLGAEWNILKGGYLDSKNQIKSLDIDKTIQSEIAKLQNSKKNVPLKMNQCIYWFNFQKTALLNKREKILSQQSEIIEKLYFAKKLNKDFLLKNHTRIAEINGMRGIYQSYNEYISPLFDSSYLSLQTPLFDLNYEMFLGNKISDGSEQNSRIDSLGKVLTDRIENQNKWFNEIRFKTYARYNYFDVIVANPTSRSFFSAGISSTIPLQFKHKEQNILEKEKIYKQLEVLEQTTVNKRIELLNEAYEYRYQLKQYIIFDQKKILLNESIRQERVKAKLLDADFNPLHGLELIDDLLQVDIELLDLKQNLYIKLLKMHEKMQGIEMNQLIVPLFLPNYFNFEDETNRTVYIWSKTFEKHSVAFLSEYIAYNQFDEVEIAVTEKDEFLVQKIKLMEDLHSKGIKIHLMFGQNNMLDSKRVSSEMKDILAQFPMKLVTGIHLDIEPHTRPNWKINPEEEKSKYFNLLKETKTIALTYKIKLSIDLPLSLDSTYTNELMKSADFVRFMCYENIKEEYLLRKLKPYLSKKDSISISLRAEDFLSRNEMEEFAKKLNQSSGINTFNYHDLNRLIELGKKTLEQNEEH